VTGKTKTVAELLQKIELGWPVPSPLDEATLLEQGMHAVVLRHVEGKKAAAAVERLRAGYADWNELRVAQAQEIANCMRLGARGLDAARDVRVYLQEVFQQSHGVDLEFLRDDAQASARFVTQLPFMGLGTAHFLLWLANGRQLPITAGLVRVLDRLGLISRTASVKKARAAIQPLIPAGKNGSSETEVDFIVRLGEIASRWCDPRKPLCHQCTLVDDCKHGAKVFRDWKVQQERLGAQREREAMRQEALRKKEDEKRRREQERQLRKARATEEKRKREVARKARIEGKKREAEEKRLAKGKAKLAAQKKRDDDKKKAAAAKKKAEAERKKKAAAKKKAGTKKKAAKKPSPKKPAAKKPAPKKPAPKKPAKKATRKAAKKPTKKPAAKKPAKKPAAKKAAAKKAAKKKPAARKTSRRK